MLRRVCACIKMPHVRVTTAPSCRCATLRLRRVAGADTDDEYLETDEEEEEAAQEAGGAHGVLSHGGKLLSQVRKTLAAMQAHFGGDSSAAVDAMRTLEATLEACRDEHGVPAASARLGLRRDVHQIATQQQNVLMAVERLLKCPQATLRVCADADEADGRELKPRNVCSLCMRCIKRCWSGGRSARQHYVKHGRHMLKPSAMRMCCGCSHMVQWCPPCDPCR